MEKIQTEETTQVKAGKADKVVKKQDDKKSSFKEFNELTQLEIDALPKLSVILKKVEFKKSKSVGYDLEARIHDYLKVKPNRPIAEYEYFLLKLQLGLDMKFAQDTLKVPCRFVTGLRADDSAYHQLEVRFDNGTIISDFWFNPGQLDLLKMLYPNLAWQVREKRIDNQNLDLGNQE